MEEEYAEKPSVLDNVREKLSTFLETATPIVKKIGLLKISAAIAAILVILALVFLIPKPAFLTVSIRELDSGNPVAGAQVTLLDSNGAAIALEYSNEGGLAVFENLAPNPSLSVEVDAGSDFRKAFESVSLEPGAQASLTIQLERNLDADLNAKTIPQTTPASCPQKFYFEVTNNGVNAIEVEIVGDKDFKNLKSEKTLVDAGSKKEIEATIVFPLSETLSSKTGVARIKYTRKSVSITTQLVPPFDLRVSPESIEASVKPGETLKRIVSFENSGKVGEVKITNADVSLGGDVAAIAQARFEDESPIKPGEKNFLTFSLTAPDYKGQLVGQLVVNTPCKTFRIPIQVTVTTS